MQQTRRHILEILKEHKEATIDEISQDREWIGGGRTRAATVSDGHA